MFATADALFNTYIKVMCAHCGNLEICKKLLMETLIIHHFINMMVFFLKRYFPIVRIMLYVKAYNFLNIIYFLMTSAFFIMF